MKQQFKWYRFLPVVVILWLVPVSCRTTPQYSSTELTTLSSFAQKAPFGTKTWGPDPLPETIIAILKSKKEKNERDHLELLVEYGLRIHWKYLQHTRLARELPLESNMMLAELVRIAEIPQYTTTYEAGWLNSQFYGPFNGTGWSSYQIYVWVKEHIDWITGLDGFQNGKRIDELLKTIENSDLNGLGGKDICHYGCS